MSTLWNCPHIRFAIHLSSVTLFIKRLSSLGLHFLASLPFGTGFTHLSLVFVQMFQLVWMVVLPIVGQTPNFVW